MKKLILLLLISTTLFAQPDLRKKISQMIMIGFPGKTASDTTLINDLQIRGVGSVILFSGNIDSPTQLKQLTDDLKSLSGTPLFIAIDQEGGRVARLRGSNGYTNTSTAQEIGEMNSETATRNWAGLMSGWLNEGGINLDLAPVADVNIDPESPAIGLLERSFSKYPDSVYQHCFWFIDELHKQGIKSALKHFPGHGSASADSHLGFTDITNTWADSELIPYRKLIQSGYNDFIMSGHLFNSNLDSLYPASLSNKILTGILRNELDYRGLIITDGMFMGAISNNYTFDEAVTLAINAGNDILLYTTNKLGDVSLVDSVVNIVVNKIAQGEISEERIEESNNRIMSLKGLTSIAQSENIIPSHYALTNYPNPFNPTTTINAVVPTAGIISIKLYNTVGEETAVIANGFVNAGTHQFQFNADRLASGVYFLLLQSENKFISHKIILMK